jgi:hypothetical protein
MSDNTSDDLPNIKDDAGQQFASIYVPNTRDTSNPQYHYLRIGAADSTIEGSLPSDPTNPKGDTNNQAGSTISDGISLYTTGSYTLSTPTSNSWASISTSWSSDNLTAVTNIKGDSLYTATYTTGADHGMRPATVTFQNVDQIANNAAALVNFLNGDSLTYWNGDDQSIGLGGLLWANYGFTTNLFGGTIMNLTNNSAEIQGVGSYKVSDSNTISATDNILLSVSPLASYAGSLTIINAFVGVMAALTAVTTAMNFAMTGELKNAGLNETALRKAMQTLYVEEIVATGLVTLVQALSVVLAAVLKIQAAAAGAALASIRVDEFGIHMQSSDTRFDITPGGIEMTTVGAIEMDANLFVVEADTSATITSADSVLTVAPPVILLEGMMVNVMPG